MSEEIGELFNTITTIYINDRPVQAKLPSALQDSVIRKIDGKYYIEYGILDYIEHLQQKVEQLEKENIKQKEIIENLTTMTVCGDKKQIKNTAQYKLEQLENIRKEVIEYIKDNACYSEGHCKCSFSQIALDNLLNILNKGSDK